MTELKTKNVVDDRIRCFDNKCASPESWTGRESPYLGRNTEMQSKRRSHLVFTVANARGPLVVMTSLPCSGMVERGE